MGSYSIQTVPFIHLILIKPGTTKNSTQHHFQLRLHFLFPLQISYCEPVNVQNRIAKYECIGLE